MTRDEALARLCKLQEEVHAHIGYAYAADCFCGHGGFWGTKGYDEAAYRNDGAAVEFIEATVRAALSSGAPRAEREETGK